MIRRREVILGTLAGAPYLFWHGITLLTAGLLSFSVPLNLAVSAYAVQPALAVLGARTTGGIAGAAPISAGNDLRRVLRVVLLLPVLGLPLGAWLLVERPHTVPAVVVALIGAHLLPLAWLLHHVMYALGGLVLIAGVAALYLVMGKGAFHFAGLVFGVVLLLGSWPAYAYAERLRRRSGD